MARGKGVRANTDLYNTAYNEIQQMINTEYLNYTKAADEYQEMVIKVTQNMTQKQMEDIFRLCEKNVAVHKAKEAYDRRERNE